MPLPEKALIAKIRDRVKSRRVHPAIVIAGIGDDCGVLRLPTGHDSLVTTDFSLEGIHFRRDWHAPEVVGHCCLTRGLSDIAAMGGEPVAAFLSLALPRSLPQSWVNRFIRGLTNLAEKYGVLLAGGDTAESPDGVLADIVVVGSVPRGEAILRSGARAGDRVYVSGTLGASAAALAQLRLQSKRHSSPRSFARQFRPEPRIELGRVLREKGLVTAMIDLSDGLSTDLAHICEESEVGAEIDSRAIPRAGVGKPTRKVSLEFALHGGEDYELLFTAPRERRVPPQIAGVTITQIGHITPRRKVFLLSEHGPGVELTAKGWEHFRS